MLHKLYQKQVEAWKERFLKETGKGYFAIKTKHDYVVDDTLIDGLLLSRHKDTIELIEAEIERKRKMRRDGEWKGIISAQEDEVYNSAIDEDIAYLEGELRKFKNEQ